MILTCSQCNTQFSINPGALGARGRNVKCSRCNHSWFQVPETQPPPAPLPAGEAPPPPSPQEVPKLDREPIPIAAAAADTPPPAKKQAGAGLKLATVFLFLLAAGSGLLFGLPKLKIAGVEKLQEAVGLTDRSGFALQKIAIEKIPTGSDKMTLAFSGALKNNIAVTKPSPALAVILYDRSGREIRTLEYPFPIATIEAGKTIPFDPKIKNIPDSLSRVVLELGNPVEQLLR